MFISPVVFFERQPRLEEGLREDVPRRVHLGGPRRGC